VQAHETPAKKRPPPRGASSSNPAVEPHPTPKPSTKAKAKAKASARRKGNAEAGDAKAGEAKARTAVEPATPVLGEQVIVEAAVELLAESGVAGLTMRDLSARLGVALGATYRHVRSKHELLKLVAQDLYRRAGPVDPGADGFAQAKMVMIQLHGLLGAYPGLAGYIGENMGDFTSLSTAQLVNDPLRNTGLSERTVQEVSVAMVLFTAGHLLVRDALPDWEGSDHQASFVAGLDLLLAGARTQVGSPSRRAVSERR
jgi:AcrR family transcriptional regulator